MSQGRSQDWFAGGGGGVPKVANVSAGACPLEFKKKPLERYFVHSAWRGGRIPGNPKKP